MLNGLSDQVHEMFSVMRIILDEIALAALGVPNKLIAYEVGISDAGVSQALRAAMTLRIDGDARAATTPEVEVPVPLLRAAQRAAPEPPSQRVRSP